MSNTIGACVFVVVGMVAATMGLSWLSILLVIIAGVVVWQFVEKGYRTIDLCASKATFAAAPA